MQFAAIDWGPKNRR